MDGFYLALGVTFVLPFLQWAVPAMPKILAYAGVAGGIAVMLAEFLDPTMKPPFGVVILFLIGVLCIGGATHLYVQFLENPKPNEKAATDAAAPKPELKTSAVPAPVQNAGRPWLEATRDSEINANGALIAGEFPNIGQFARLDGGSKLNMQGVMIIGQNAPTQFPPPTGEFSSLTNTEIHEQARELVSNLLGFQKEYDGQKVDSGWGANKTMEERQKKMDQNKDLYARSAEKYNKGKLPTLARSLASEMLGRSGAIDVASAPQNAQMGSFVVLQGRYAGGDPAGSAAAFIEFLAQRVPN
jgi:hypothetical protein